MKKYYFTYGTDETCHPFVGGWTEIEAPDKQTAYAAVKAFHPKRPNGCLPFCDCYSEEEFAVSGMNGSEGNFGRRCHERICLTRELCGGAE